MADRSTSLSYVGEPIKLERQRIRVRVILFLALASWCSICSRKNTSGRTYTDAAIGGGRGPLSARAPRLLIPPRAVGEARISQPADRPRHDFDPALSDPRALRVIGRQRLDAAHSGQRGIARRGGSPACARWTDRAQHQFDRRARPAPGQRMDRIQRPLRRRRSHGPHPIAAVLAIYARENGHGMAFGGRWVATNRHHPTTNRNRTNRRPHRAQTGAEDREIAFI